MLIKIFSMFAAPSSKSFSPTFIPTVAVVLCTHPRSFTWKHNLTGTVKSDCFCSLTVCVCIFLCWSAAGFLYTYVLSVTGCCSTWVPRRSVFCAVDITVCVCARFGRQPPLQIAKIVYPQFYGRRKCIFSKPHRRHRLKTIRICKNSKSCARVGVFSVISGQCSVGWAIKTSNTIITATVCV